jgi:hypothetical protein
MDDFFPCLALVGVLFLIFGFLAVRRYNHYRKAISLAEQGLPHPEPKTGLLRWGILVTALGLVLSVGLYIVGFAGGNDYPLRLGPWMLGGFVPLLLGLSLILFHFLFQNSA